MYLNRSSFSLQGELVHCQVKGYYPRTNKIEFVKQITRLERREHALKRRRNNLAKNLDILEKRRQAKRCKRSQRSLKATVSFEESEVLGETPPEVHHHISHSRNFPVSLSPRLRATEDELEEFDVAEKV